jgi:hypothetical protein
VLVLVRFLIMPAMLMIVRTVHAGVIMDMPGLVRSVLVRMLVLVRVHVRMGVRVRMRMHANARMLVRMLMLVGVFVRVIVGMLMVALHGLPPLFDGSSGGLSPHTYK